jgi:hypothetical protein
MSTADVTVAVHLAKEDSAEFTDVALLQGERAGSWRATWVFALIWKWAFRRIGSVPGGGEEARMLRKSRVASMTRGESSRRGAWFAVPAGEAAAVEDDERTADFADHGDSVARSRWADRLGRYVDQQGPIDALRLRSPSEPPWPQTENPMVGYLTERSSEIFAEEGLDAALAWLVANAWFEGVVAERVRIARSLDDE